GPLDERLRPDGLTRAHELLHDAPENRLLPFAELQCFLHLQEILAAVQARISAVTPPPRKRPRRVRASVSPPSTARPSISARARPSASSARRTPPTGSGSSSRRPSITRSRARVSSSSSSISRS